MSAVSWPETAVRVRAPATSANLGPGFDALGLALTLYDEVDVAVTGSGLKISVSGEGAETADAGERHLVVRAMRAAFAELGGQPPGIELRCVNRIPHGRGLGSSAAAIITGVLAARALSGAGGQYPADSEAVLRLATELEGHPDNVAACLAGGLTIAWMTPGSPPLGRQPGKPGRPRLVRLSPRGDIIPVVCIAPEAVSTEVARHALPGMIAHADAAANAGRCALLIAALTWFPGPRDLSPPAPGPPAPGPPAPAKRQPSKQDSRPPVAVPLRPAAPNISKPALSTPHPSPPADLTDLLFDATEDLLHQRYRAEAMPNTAALLGALRAARIPAVVSGAGPSVLAFLAAAPPRGAGTSQREAGTSQREAAGPHPGVARPAAGDSGPGLDRLDSIVRETGIAWRISLLEVDGQGATVQSVTPGASVV